MEESRRFETQRYLFTERGPPLDLKVEAVEFSSLADGIVLAGWLIPTGSDRAVVLIHGIDSDAWAGAAPDVAAAYADAGFDVLLFDASVADLLRRNARSGFRVEE